MIHALQSVKFAWTSPDVRSPSTALALERLASARAFGLNPMSNNSPPSNALQPRPTAGQISISSLLNEEEPLSNATTSPLDLARTTYKSSPSAATPLKFLRISQDSIDRLKMLHPQENITLLTPLVPPLQTSRSEGSSAASASGVAATQPQPPTDPFEPLGRALSRHHRRIRHVPYVPDRQLTETHLPFLREAHAIIIVVCDAAGAAASPRSSLEAQVAFARDVHRRVTNPGDAQAEAIVYQIPVILVLVTEEIREQGAVAGIKDSLIGQFGAGTILHCGSYSKSALERIANRIFDENTLDRARDQQAEEDIEMDS